MINFRKINLIKIRNFLKKIPKILGEKAFLTFLGLLIIASLIGEAVFYKYNILIKKTEVSPPDTSLEFQEKNYQDVLKVWQDKEKNFEEADSRQYPNPFQ